jgi:hypothetical protein
MLPYIMVVASWALAVYFYKAYYGIRVPEKYIKPGWKGDEGVAQGAIQRLHLGFAVNSCGNLLFGWGFALLHQLFIQSSGPLPPLPTPED